jgi:hypothetical protein
MRWPKKGREEGRKLRGRRKENVEEGRYERNKENMMEGGREGREGGNLNQLPGNFHCKQGLQEQVQQETPVQ